MNIEIWDGKYKIKSDSRQYKLLEVKEKLSKEDGEAEASSQVTEDGKYEVNIGYFSNISQLFKSLAEREGRLNKCTTLDGYVKHIEKVNGRLEEVINNIQAIIGTEESLSRIMFLQEHKLSDKIKNIGEEMKPQKKVKKK